MVLTPISRHNCGNPVIQLNTLVDSTCLFYTIDRIYTPNAAINVRLLGDSWHQCLVFLSTPRVVMTETNNTHSRCKRDTACQCNTKPPKASILQSTTIYFLDTSKLVKILKSQHGKTDTFIGMGPFVMSFLKGTLICSQQRGASPDTGLYRLKACRTTRNTWMLRGFRSSSGISQPHKALLYTISIYT